MIDRTISHYRILEKLGEGGMGVVYKALDVKLDRLVALKFLPHHMLEKEEARLRFIHEGKAASALDHPNVGTIYEIDETSEGQMFIAMGFYDGVTLKRKLEEGPAGVDEAIGIAIQIADGLAEAHKRDIVHRDIKPSNIIITTDGVVKIVDFGLAKLSDATRLTRTGETTGTPAYMSPEQARCEQIDQRSDIFSLGTVLYEMLAGSHPFDTKSPATAIHSIIYDEPQPLSRVAPAIPGTLGAIVEKAMKKDPSRRYQSASDLATDLTQVRQEIGVAEPTQVLKIGSIKKKVLARKILIPILAAAAAGMALLGYAVHSGHFGSGAGLPPFLARMSKPAQEKFTIAVAPFSGQTKEEKEEGKAMQAILARKLKEILGGEEDVRILAPDLAEPPRSHTDAKNAGRRLGASTVLWGEVLVLRGEVEIQPYMSIVTPIKKVADVSSKALQALLTEPNQIDLRKSKAEEVSNMALMAAARYYKRRDSDKALAIIEKLPATDPERFIMQGQVLTDLGRHDEAVEASRQACMVAPHSTRALTALGWALHYGDRKEEALAEFERACEITPGGPEVLANLASFYGITNRWDLQRATYEKMITLEPTYGGAYFIIARAYEQLGRYGDAITQYQRGLALNPLDVDERHWLGMLYIKIHRYDEAIAEFLQATKLAPKDPSPYAGLGYAYADTGHFKEAIRAFRAAIDLEPTNFSTHIGLGNAYGNLGKRHQAVKAFENAIDHNDESLPGAMSNDMIHLFVGYNYRMLGWYDKAVAEIQKAIAADSASCDYRYYLGAIYEDLGRYQDALDEYEESIQLAPDAWWVWWIGPRLHYFLCLYRVGDQEGAEAYLREYAERLGPNLGQTDAVFRDAVRFYLGQLPEEAIFKASASRDSKGTWDSDCITHYYVGMAHLLNIRAISAATADTVKARDHLEQCLATRDHDVDEYRSAKAEMARLNKR